MKNFTINELRENRARAWEQAKQFLDSHRDEKGMLSAKDVATYEKLEQEIIGLGEEIKRNERGLALDAELSRTVGTPLTNKPGTGNNQKTGRASDAYKGAMLNALAPTSARSAMCWWRAQTAQAVTWFPMNGTAA